ncbi:hypothetical protein SARC_04162 [Sphaeroforma arctica JP610]|uniref:Uncharacterized protein n=1 Tax=Sphaeroforma arctica JP610 TaxID=667725 RepID=A0A0L0G425_9EUKA|nr:hypothetical protein SARC_04162 [Sphaeroforma arctica JP610]KNC83604.1 hypothetical protein SARC_04162 [Sphaeroforma arctica JP610]|eukprot:XP_014157506.1 hypothetical protein SARC_04162 [Sphaeroforma arctica JP610]
MTALQSHGPPATIIPTACSPKHDLQGAIPQIHIESTDENFCASLDSKLKLTDEVEESEAGECSDNSILRACADTTASGDKDNPDHRTTAEKNPKAAISVHHVPTCDSMSINTIISESHSLRNTDHAERVVEYNEVPLHIEVYDVEESDQHQHIHRQQPDSISLCSSAVDPIHTTNKPVEIDQSSGANTAAQRGFADQGQSCETASGSNVEYEDQDPTHLSHHNKEANATQRATGSDELTPEIPPIDLAVIPKRLPAQLIKTSSLRKRKQGPADAIKVESQQRDVYDRKPDCMPWLISGAEMQEVSRELNAYKTDEMPVHEESRQNTRYHNLKDHFYDYD